MAKQQKPKVGRPFSEGTPLTKRVCGYFSEEEHARLFDLAKRTSRAENANVTVAELVRRAVRDALDRSGS